MILSRSIDEGDYVTTNNVCGEMYGTRYIELPISLPASERRWLGGTSGELDLMKDPIPATVTWTEQGTGREFRWQGRVRRIQPGLDPRTRTLRLFILIDNEKQPEGTRPLDINRYCTADISGREIPRAFVIPRSSVQPDGTVYLVEDGKLAKRQVTVARFDQAEAIVLPGNGLDAGDRVVRSYIPKPVLGMAIVVDDSDPDESPSDSGKVASSDPAAAAPSASASE
jgi:hypothetical protein